MGAAPDEVVADAVASRAGGDGAARAGRRRAPRLTARRALIAVAAGGALAEGALLIAIGPAGATPLAPQATAPPPFDVFHDLRWLLVYHRSWLTLAAGALGLLALRTGYYALMVRAAWPADRPRPSWGALLPRAAAFTATAVVLTALWAGLMLAMAVVSLSWLFFAAVPSMLIVAVLMSAGPAAARWWGRRPPLRAALWMLTAFLVITMSAAVVSHSRWAPVTLAAVAAAGLFNAWAWHGIVHAVAGSERPRLSVRIPFLPIGVVLLAIVVIGGSWAGFKGRGERAALRERAAEVPAVADGQPVLVVRGFQSAWSGRAASLLGDRFSEWRFSYRGLDGRGLPVAYGQTDTHKDLRELVRMMDAQVRSLAARVGGRISIVAESEGALIARAYVAGAPDAPVEELLALSPLVRPARIYYPPPGREGWGVAGGWLMRGVGGIVRALSGFSVSADAPFMRSLVEDAGAVRFLFACPADGIEVRNFVPLADAVASPQPLTGGVPTTVVPAFHGGLLDDGAVQDALVLALRDEPLPARTIWSVTAEMVRGGAAAWHAPELPLGLNPVWTVDPPEDTLAAQCAAAHRQIAGWLR